jgi:glycosyltransferase involved in cell wall biosynthesis
MYREIKFYVIIPVYNGEKYIKKCLDSIINQNYENWEILIVDDFSNDLTHNIALEYHKNDYRINVFRNEKNLGPGGSRNYGIIKSIEKIQKTNIEIMNNYIVFIDSDDWIDLNYFDMANKLILDKLPDVIFVDVIQEYESGEFIKIEKMSNYKNREKIELIRHQLTGKLPWGGVRKLANAVLFLDEKIRFSMDFNGEEAIYSFRLLAKANSIEFIEKALYHYIIHYI